MERDFKGVWIPKEIWLNQELGWSEKLLLVEIDSLAKNGQCFASNEYFAKFLGCHKKHISRLVSNLSDMGLIRVELIYKPNSKQIDKRIIHVTTRNKNVPTLVQKCSEPRNKNVPTPRNKNVEDSSFIINTDNNNTIINTTNKRVSASDLEAEFEYIWKQYPRKLGKAKALASYKKARKKDGYETILNGLKRYCDYISDRKIEEQFVMHGSTWFAQAKWHDEYTSTAPKGKFSEFTKMALDNMENPEQFLNMLGVDGYEQRGNERIIVDG